MIEEIKKIGKGNRYYLILDDGRKFTLEAEILAKHKLKSGEELEENKLKEILLANGDLSAFDRGLTYLEKNIKTEKGIREYLKGKGFLDESIDKAVEKLNEYGYINDESFADSYIRTYSNKKGKKLLKYELMAKGVSCEIIEKKLEEIDENEQAEACKKLFEKYIKNKTFDLKLKQKAFSYLFSKGFSNEVVSRVMKNYEIEDNIND